jgi:hypothetical protein
MTTATDLLSMKGHELDDLFRAATGCVIPSGSGSGQALMATGTRAARPFVSFVRATSWRGKDFDDDTSTLLNRIGPGGWRAIKADVRMENSWLDEQPCVVLDYSKTSRVARWIRDEIREISPGLYLGMVYVRSRRAPLRFSLSFPVAESAPQVEVAGNPVAVGDVH